MFNEEQLTIRADANADISTLQTDQETDQKEEKLWYYLRKKLISVYINFLQDFSKTLGVQLKINDYLLLIYGFESNTQEEARVKIEQILKFLESDYILLLDHTTENKVEMTTEWRMMLSRHRGLIFRTSANTKEEIEKIFEKVENDLDELKQNLLSQHKLREIIKTVPDQVFENIFLNETLNPNDIYRTSLVCSKFYALTSSSSFWESKKYSFHELIDLIYQKGKVSFLLRLFYLDYAYLRGNCNEIGELDLKFKRHVLDHYSKILTISDKFKLRVQAEFLIRFFKDFDDLFEKLIVDHKQEYKSLKTFTLQSYAQQINTDEENELNLLGQHVTQLCTLYSIKDKQTIADYLHRNSEQKIVPKVIPLVIPGDSLGDRPAVEYGIPSYKYK